ncbi:MAG: hypothetical protein AB8B92_00980 [Gammaproteobacteria bacterium]
MIKRTSLYVLVFISLSIAAPIVSAYAYCSLRDPVSAIHELYPESTSHKSIVKVVDKNTRNIISESLPFTLQFNELGKHTLYVASKDRTPLGLVHARTELTEWGLIEIAWALNLDYSIRDFFIQRCRIPACDKSNLEFLKGTLKGKSYSDVLELLKSNGNAITIDVPSKPTEIPSLTLSILKSALKTISVTKIVWKSDIEKFNHTTLIHKSFPEVENYSVNSVHINKLSLNEIHNSIGYETTYIHHPSVKTYTVNNADSYNLLGYLIEAEWNSGNHYGIFTWIISHDGTVLDVQPKQAWENTDIEDSFTSLIGQNLNAISVCNTLAEVTALELFLMSGIH